MTFATSFKSIALLAALLAWAQQTPVRDNPQLPTGTGVISGIVVSADGAKTPVRRVTVSLAESGSFTRVAVTGDDGRFAFRNLAPGRYTATADKQGYVPAAFGSTRIERPGTGIALAAGQTISDISISLTRGSVITGVISDEHGAPLRDLRVVALRYVTTPTGERTLSPMRNLMGTTDDRGVYRTFGLPPGDYVMVVTPGAVGGAQEISEADFQRIVQGVRAGASAQPASPGVATDSRQSRSSAPIFFPGTGDVSLAQTIHVGAAEERAGANFMAKPIPTVKISGTIVGVDGQPAAGIPVQLFQGVRIPLVTFPPVPVTSDRDGKFVFQNIPPGPYSVLARPGGAGRGGGAAAPAVLWAQTEVAVGNSDVTVSLALQPGVTVSGKLTFDNHDAAPPDPTRVRVNLRAVVSGNQAQIGVPDTAANAAGEFSFPGVVPGRYRVEVTAPGRGAAGATWVVKAVTASNRDALDTPMEVGSSGVSDLAVTVTDRPVELTGRLQDANGLPAPDYTVLLFPKDPAKWTGVQTSRFQQARPGKDGMFAIRGMPAGEYLFATVTDIDFNEMYNAAFLQQLVGAAVPLTLADGEKKVLNLQVK